MLLDQVPDEIIHHLLYYISPEDNLSQFQTLSRRLSSLANESLLWRYYCRTEFQYWNPRHNLQHKLSQRVTDVNWKSLFLFRRNCNKKISHLLDGILSTKVGRWKKFEQIARLGYDAKDFLLTQCHADDHLEDVLARRYYSHSLLDSIHRSLAVEEWHIIQTASLRSASQQETFVLERVLGAFDMFVLHDQPGDMDDISRILDEKAAEFRQSTPRIHEMTTRQKALELNRWLRAKNLTGLRNPERSYRNLRNCLIGQALRHEDHDSIPLISSAIFCCIAQRLGVEAQCCAFPTHVHVIVSAETGQTLDGHNIARADFPRDQMYLDPYGADEETSLETLQAILTQFGWHANTDVFLSPVSAISIAMRAARNIKATSARVFESRDQTDSQMTQLITGNSSMNMEAALYAAFWASLLLTSVQGFEWDESLEPFLRRFSKNWNEDAWLVEKYLCPLYERFAHMRDGLQRHGPHGWDDPREILGLVRELDDLAPPVFRRDQAAGEPVPHKIGQAFRHRRYQWIGVINGWTDQGTRRLPMPHTVAIDETLDDSSDTDLPSLRRPRNQTFYTCLRTTGTERHVVAEDNIVLVNDPADLPPELFPLAGRFFKRFDRATCSFVSNIQEQYPDD